MKITTFSEFRRYAAAFFTEVEKGETIRVLRHGHAIGDVVPIRNDATPSWKRPPPKLLWKGGSLTKALLKARREAGA